MSGDSGGSRKRVFISLADKQGIIKKIESGKKLPNVASEYGISRSQVYKIYKLKDQITKKCVPKDCKIMKAKPRYKEIDEAVFEWVRFLRSHYGGRRPVPVSRALIKARAIYEAKARNISDFKASDGWFWRWRWRFNVGRSVALHGEAADVDLAKADKEVDRIRSAILDGKFNPNNIFNMDETALFYRTIPNRTYLVSSDVDKRQAGKGSKQMRCKDRLTVVLCVNATGTCKLDPVVIGCSKKPRCFRDNPPSIPYFHQANAWNDRALYARWWEEVFLKKIREWTSDPVALIIDGFKGHDSSCTDPLGQVTVFVLPPNTTSVFQPLDAGIIAATKAHYKSLLLGKVVSVANNYTELQALAAQMTAGCAGLDYGSQAHVSDAINLVVEAWNCISSSVVLACWKHAKCLAPRMLAEPSDVQDGTVVQMEQETVRLMKGRLLELNGTNLDTAQMLQATGLDEVLKAIENPETTADVIMTAWLHIEENADIQVDAGSAENAEPEDDVKEEADVVSLQKQMLPLLHNMHSLCAKLHYSDAMTFCREQCVNILNKLKC